MRLVTPGFIVGLAQVDPCKVRKHLDSIAPTMVLNDLPYYPEAVVSQIMAGHVGMTPMAGAVATPRRRAPRERKR